MSEIVLPAWQEYLQADGALSQATQSADAAWRRAASFTALRHGASAAIFLHHFTEVVVRSKPPFLPQGASSVADVRNWLAQHCFELRTATPCGDVALLGDVADALKHCVLTQRVAARQISATDDVLVVAMNYGAMGYGMGNFGGADQVVVLARMGTRPLSTLLQNVIDAWHRAIGLSLPNTDEP